MDQGVQNIINTLEFIWQQVGSVNFQLLCGSFSDVALILLAIVATVFVLAVTILGKAAKITKEQKEDQEQKSNQDFDKDIKELEASIKTNPKSIEELKKRILDIESKKKYTASILNELDNKYYALGIKEGVFIPSIYFFVIIIFGNWLVLASTNKIWQFFIFLSTLALFVFGIRKVVLTLQAIEYFSLNIRDNQPEQLQAAMINALMVIEKEKEPKPFLSFQNPKPPFILRVGEDNTIEFVVALKNPGGNTAKNVDVWFLTSPEIEIIETSDYAASFKQKQEYNIPYANTIIYKIKEVRIGTKSVGKIKLRASKIGNFKMRYKINCENHSEPSSADKEIGIIVQE